MASSQVADAVDSRDPRPCNWLVFRPERAFINVRKHDDAVQDVVHRLFQITLVFGPLIFTWLLRFEFTLPYRSLLFDTAPILIAIRLGVLLTCSPKSEQR
jgi:hypothetical protein